MSPYRLVIQANRWRIHTHHFLLTNQVCTSGSHASHLPDQSTPHFSGPVTMLLPTCCRFGKVHWMFWLLAQSFSSRHVFWRPGTVSRKRITAQGMMRRTMLTKFQLLRIKLKPLSRPGLTCMVECGFHVEFFVAMWRLNRFPFLELLFTSVEVNNNKILRN